MHDLIEQHLDRIEALKSASTHDVRSSELRRFNEWVDDHGYDITEMDALEIEQYLIENKNQGYARETLGSQFQSIFGLFTFLTGKVDVYEEHPMDGLKRGDYDDGGRSKKFKETDMVYVDPDEVEAMAANVTAPSLRNELLIRLLFHTGVRIGEAVSIDVDDIDLDHRSIRIHATKTEKRRTVYYQPSLDILLEQWINGGHRAALPKAAESSRLFLTSRDVLSPDWAGKLVHRAAENAGIQEVMYIDAGGANRYRITPHALRHGHAVQALKSGIDVRTLQRHLGHENLEMTMRYLQLIDDDVQHAYRRFDPAPED